MALRSLPNPLSVRILLTATSLHLLSSLQESNSLSSFPVNPTVDSEFMLLRPSHMRTALHFVRGVVIPKVCFNWEITLAMADIGAVTRMDIEWSCPTCTYINKAGSFKCSVCGTLKGTATRQVKYGSLLFILYSCFFILWLCGDNYGARD